MAHAEAAQLARILLPARRVGAARVEAQARDDHERVFRVACETSDPELVAEAEASSLRAAEQLAAERLLATLEQA